MYQERKVGLVLLMAGLGERCGGKEPKQFAKVKDIPVYLHTLKIFQKLSIFDQIVLVTHPDWILKVQEEAPYATVVSGGKTRQESSFLGLKGFSPAPEIVMVHDAVRPFVSEKIILDNLHGAMIHGAVDTCISSADTIVHSPCGEKIAAIPKRKEYFRGQTPQTFRFEWLWEAHQNSSQENVSDDCQLVLRSGRPIHIVEGCESNFKITTNYDIFVFNKIIDNLFK